MNITLWVSHDAYNTIITLAVDKTLFGVHAQVSILRCVDYVWACAQSAFKEFPPIPDQFRQKTTETSYKINY